MRSERFDNTWEGVEGRREGGEEGGGPRMVTSGVCVCECVCVCVCVCVDNENHHEASSDRNAGEGGGVQCSEGVAQQPRQRMLLMLVCLGRWGKQSAMASGNTSGGGWGM